MQSETLDPQVVNLAKAIRQSESGGDFNASGKSGEHGAYQYTEPTWAKDSASAGVNVPLKQATPEQQNQVAYTKLKAWKDAGHNVGQIASMWNAGEGEPDAYTGKFSNGQPSVGTNKEGVHFDVPTYAKSVAAAYQKLKSGGQAGLDPNNPSATAPKGGFVDPAKTAQGENNFVTPPSQVPESPDTATSTKTPDASPTSMGGVAADVGTGFLKGAIGTVKNIADMGNIVANQTAGRAANMLSGKGNTPTSGGLIPGTEAVDQNLDKNLQSTNAYQTAGKIGEGIGEAFLPLPGKAALAEKASEGLLNSATRDITKVLSPTTKLNKVITQKVAPGLAQKGLISMSREGMMAKVEQQLGNAGEALSEEYKKLPSDAKIEVSGIFEGLQKKMDALMVNGVVPSASAGEHAALQNVLKDMTNIGLSVAPDGSKVFADVGNVRQLRQLLDTGKTKFAFTDLDHATKGAQTFLANSIREEFGKSYPNIAKLNKDYNFWSNISKVLGDAIERKTGQSGLLRKGIGAGLGMGAASASHPIIGAGIGKLVTDFISSPAWHTTSAAIKSKLANTLAKSNATGAQKIIQETMKATPYLAAKGTQGLLPTNSLQKSSP